MHAGAKYQLTINGNVVDVDSLEMIDLILGMTVVSTSASDAPATSCSTALSTTMSTSTTSTASSASTSTSAAHATLP